MYGRRGRSSFSLDRDNLALYGASDYLECRYVQSEISVLVVLCDRPFEETIIFGLIANFSRSRGRKRMKIVVTGALGHIGSALIRQLPLHFPAAEIVMLDNMMTQRYASLSIFPRSVVQFR